MSALRRARQANLDLFLLADRLHFDDPLRLDSTGLPHAREYEVALPDTWRCASDREWMTALPHGWEGPVQGWKIHVSAVPRTARAILRAVVDYCVAEDLAFKYLRSELVLLVRGGKYASRSSSGKFLTLYPRDDAQLFAAVDALQERIGGAEGPTILSDLRWRDGPIHVRYGGFVERWCEDEDGHRVHAIEAPDGSLVPDRRLPYAVIPEWVEVPARFRTAEQGADELAACAYTFDEALHFSNAGGVYRGRRRSDGRRVVLKEARPHAGLDGFGADAVERLEREHEAHTALAGLDAVPTLIDLVHLGGHTFLVSEYAEADTLQQWVATRHPGIRVGFPDDREAVAAYTREALAILRGLTEAVAAFHDSGWAHGDLHPGNVLVTTDGRVCVVDFELAARFDSRVPVGLGCPGFARPDRRRDDPIGVDDDHYALGALALWLFLPIAIALSVDPSRAAAHAAWAERMFDLPPTWRALVHRGYGRFAASGAPAQLSPPSLVRAIRASATPERSDRLFPGDVLQFLENGAQFAAGAAGVLWSLDRLGEDIPSTWAEWLVRAVDDVAEPGLFSGWAGIAAALDVCGRPERASALLEKAADEVSTSADATLYSGRAGVGLAMIGAGGCLDRALRLADGILDARVPSARTPTGRAAGLMDGWSGVAVFLTALAVATGEERYLDEAEECVRRDLRTCVEGPGGALLVEERGILYPYLAHGSAGIAVAAARVARAGRLSVTERQIDGLVRASSPAVVIEPGIFDGRAGLMIALDELHRAGLADTRAVVSQHAIALDLHAVAYREGLATVGRGLSRVSMDFATGSAGIATALSAVADGRGAFPFFETPVGATA